jgi:hypothetical protein
MTIATGLAVYKTAPLVLAVESAEGAVCERSLADLHGAGRPPMGMRPARRRPL